MVKRLIYGALLFFIVFAGLQVAPLSAEEDSSHFYYYILVDRFENGTTENDTNKLTGIQQPVFMVGTIKVFKIILII